jgi:hypothetical protein
VFVAFSAGEGLAAKGTQHGDTRARPLRAKEDRNLNCPALHSTVLDLVDQMKRLLVQARKEERSPAPTVYQMMQRAWGPPEAGNKALEDYQRLHVRTHALAEVFAAKRCGNLEVAALLKPVAVPTIPATDRCRVRTELGLEDCVEDIAQWRCRRFAGRGRDYLECLDKVAVRVIAASGFQKSRLARYDPDCTNKTYDPSSCSVFSNDRNGAGTEWCQRVDEANIKVCDQASGRSAATPDPTKNGTQRKSSDRGSQTQSKGGMSDPSKVGPSKGGIRTNCHNVQCALGTCNQLCSPPRRAAAQGHLGPPAA